MLHVRKYNSAHDSFILCLNSPPSVFTYMPGCALAHIFVCFLTVLSLNARLIFIPLGAKLFSYFYLQSQQLFINL